MHSSIDFITKLSCLKMEFKFVTFTILLCLLKIEFSGTNAVQNDSNQRQVQQPLLIRGSATESLNSFVKQLNIRPDLNERRMFDQNSKPITGYQLLKVDRNRPLISRFQNDQKPNLRQNNFITIGNNGVYSQITQNRFLPQSQNGKQSFQSTENRYLDAYLPKSLVSEENRRRFIDIKQNAHPKIRPILPSLKNPSVGKIREEERIKQEHVKQFLALPNNQNNIAHLGNNEENIKETPKERRNVPIQNSGGSKRYTLIRKNGALEYYDDLETILKKYPLIKLPQNLQSIPSHNPVAKVEFKAPENMRPLLVTKPHTKVNIPYSKNHNLQLNNVPVPNQLKHSINNFQVKSLQNSNKSSYDIQAQRGSTLPANIKRPTYFLPENVKIDQTLKQPFVSGPVLNKTAILSANDEKSDKIKHLTNQVANLTTERKEDIPLHENVINKAKVTNASYADHGDLLEQTNHVEENSATRLPSSNATGHKNVDNPLNKSISLTDKFEKPLIYPKIISNLQKNKTLEAWPTISLSQHESPLFPVEEPNRTVNLTTATKLPSLSKKEQFESFNVKNLNNLSIPKNISQVIATNLNNTESLKKTEKNENITDQKMLGEQYIDNTKDLLSLLKPVTWFTTDDPYFWNKLVDDDDNSFVYIINVESHPKIERDTKTTIHANGTIVEEITETTWLDNDDNPTVTKTVKVSPSVDKKN